MKRTTAWIGITVLLCLLMGTIVAAQDGGVSTTVALGARLRAGPGTEWALLGNIEAGTSIVLDGRAPGGGWVRGILPDGKIGWVIDTAIALSPEQITALPGVWVDTPFGLSAPSGDGSVPPADQPAEAAPPAGLPEGGLHVTVASRVNMRSAPQVGASLLVTLGVGTPIALDGRDDAQEWVRGTLADGTTGWVSVRFLTVTAGQVVGLPVVEGGAVAPPAAPPVVPAVPIEAVVNTAPVRGFSYGGHVEAFGEDAVNAMRLAGMTWAKRQWRYYAGQNPADVAGYINDAHAKGFRILLGIVGAPGEVNNPGYFEQYASFVGGVAALGADAIEIWNEMNIDREWPSGSIDPARYVELLRLAYNAIKGANPNTMVITGAPAPTGYYGGCSGAGCDDSYYVAGMYRAGAANYADCIGLHYNEGILGPNQTSGDPRGNGGYFTRYFWGMVNTYDDAFRGARPLCFTELGYLTPEGFPPLPGGFAWAQDVTVGQQAAWLDQAVSLSRNSGRVRLLIVWNVDFKHYGDDPMAGFAMIRPDGSCPACEALGS
jgi:uncharacterized protein YraI